MTQEIATYNSVSLLDIRRDRVTYPRINKMQPMTAISGLTSIVANAMMYTGRRAEEDDIAFISQGLYRELMLDEMNLGMKHITLQEIGYCVKKAVLGQGNEMYGINVASLYKVVADYCRGEGHELEKQLEHSTLARQEEILKASAVNAMLDQYATKMVKHSKI